MVSITVEDFAKGLDLKTVYAGEAGTINIHTSDLNRPGLQFADYFDYFAVDRIQIIGKVEMTYLDGLNYEKRFERLDKFFSYPVPCVIICRDMQVPDDMCKLALKYKVPFFVSKLVTTKFISKSINFIDKLLAPTTTKHGVLVDVYGIGIMLLGEAGIGKSETALELIKRGHRLVADDVVDICKVADNRLVGEAPDLIRHFMEIRGIGIIDIKAMYGVGAVINSKSIDLIMQLELWNSEKEYDRLGLDENHIDILGVRRPLITLPVRPGRNLAIIVEVAAMNYRLRNLGYNAAKELDKRLKDQVVDDEPEENLDDEQ